MTRAIFPHRANYVVAIDGFIGFEWLLRAVGAIGNRKFTKSINLVKAMLNVRNNGDVVVLFPEARYSLCGTSAVLPVSLGKMVRKMNIPVVTLLMHGHHINSPFWNIGNRKIMPVEAEMDLLFSQEETQELSINELNDRLTSSLVYDDYAWQKEKRVRVKTAKRAEGLHHVLYQCPSCLTEYKMTSSKNLLRCGCCGKSWALSEYGELVASERETEFSHIPDWYEWQRLNVRQEVEEGAYTFESEVRVESLPSSKGFITFEKPGLLTHDMEGFTLTGEYNGKPFKMFWKAATQYSCHIEYNYKGRGDCIDLSTYDDTFYLFPLNNAHSVTKLALATEELFRWHSLEPASIKSSTKY